MIGILGGCGSGGQGLFGGPPAKPETTLECGNAQLFDLDGHGSVPAVLPSAQSQVARYQGTPAVYGSSPEVIWRFVLLDQAQVSLFVDHPDTSDVDLFLLASCDPMDVVDRSTEGLGSEHINWPTIPAGDYYLVADAVDDMPSDQALALSYDIRRNDRGPFKWTTNGHWYEIIKWRLDWPSARDTSQTIEWRGMQAHLATVTSANEQLFLQETFGAELGNKWIGGFQQPAVGCVPDSCWEWITGEAWGYTNWATNEPNDGEDNSVDEFYLEIDESLSPLWNDQFETHTNQFIIEFESN